MICKFLVRTYRTGQIQLANFTKVLIVCSFTTRELKCEALRVSLGGYRCIIVDVRS